MPSYHSYWGYRLDVRNVPDADTRDELCDRIQKIRDESNGGDQWLRGELEQLGAYEPRAALDLLVHEADYLAWSLWSLRDGTTTIQQVTFRVGDEQQELDEDWWHPELDLPQEQLEQVRSALDRLSMDELDDEGPMEFPYMWPSEPELHEATSLVAPLLGDEGMALVFVDQSGLEGGLRLVRFAGEATIARLEPSVGDPHSAKILIQLWYHSDQTLGMDQASPEPEEPLTSGRIKARIEAIEHLSIRRSWKNLPDLLAALESPANAGKKHRNVRKALYRAISWFDAPNVWEAVLAGLRTEDADVRKTIKYVLWRLEGLEHERPDDLAQALSVRPEE